MKKEIHPTYYPEAIIKCACGNVMTIGSTKEKTETETCGACHPFYTGEKRGAIRGGRVERFQSQIKKSASMQKEPPKPKTEPKKKKSPKNESAKK